MSRHHPVLEGQDRKERMKNNLLFVVELKQSYSLAPTYKNSNFSGVLTPGFGPGTFQIFRPLGQNEYYHQLSYLYLEEKSSK